MAFAITSLCFLAVILLGLTAICFGFRDKGMEGVVDAACLHGGGVLWSFAGAVVLNSPFSRECPVGFLLFVLWELAPFVPWGAMCRKKNGPLSFRTGVAGLLAQGFFLLGGVSLCPVGRGGRLGNGPVFVPRAFDAALPAPPFHRHCLRGLRRTGHPRGRKGMDPPDRVGRGLRLFPHWPVSHRSLRVERVRRTFPVLKNGAKECILCMGFHD